MGRVRAERNGPRTIDVDVLFFGDERRVAPRPRDPPPAPRTSGASSSCPSPRSRPASSTPCSASPCAELLARCPDASAVAAPRAGGGAGLMAFHYIAVDGPDRGREDDGGGQAGGAARRQQGARGLGARTRSSAPSTTASRAPPSRPSSSSCSRATGSSRSCRSGSSSPRRRSPTTSSRRAGSSPTSTSTTSELLIFDKLFSLLSESVPKPDLVVYLQAPTEVLMKRVKRARPAGGDELLGGVPRRGEPRVQPLLLPLLGDAAPRREHRRRGLRQEPRGPRRPAEADPRHGQGHAVLRPAQRL